MTKPNDAHRSPAQRSEDARKANAVRTPEQRSIAARRAHAVRQRSRELPAFITLRLDRPSPYLVRVHGKYVGYYSTLDEAAFARDAYIRQHSIEDLYSLLAPQFAQAGA